MSKKSAKIAAMIEQFGGGPFDPHYLGFFALFNTQLFYEAHDVLEELWLADRQGPNYSFYKGLIQLAGAFVHLQKERLGPSGSLFKLARTNMLKYQSPHEGLDLEKTIALIDDWLASLEKDPLTNPFKQRTPPAINLDLARNLNARR